MTRREEWAWCAAACAPPVLGLFAAGGVLLGEDAYQYLSAADNLGAGRGLSTCLLHYDVERAAGVIPAPLTMRPAGYSMAIASLRGIGVPSVAAAGAISGVAFALLMPMLVAAGRSLRLTPLAQRLALIWVLTNSWSFVYPSAAITESLFAALVSGAVTLLLAFEQDSDWTPRRMPLVAAGTLVGLAYWVRYAGLLVFGGVLIYYGLQWLRRRRRQELIRLVCVAAPAALLIGLSVLRNVRLTGSWTGGYDLEGTWTLSALTRQLASALYHLFLGGAAAAPLGAAELVLAFSVVTLAILTVWPRRPPHDSPAVPDIWRPAQLLAVVLVVYAIGLVAVARVGRITFDTRMLYPMLPLAILGLAIGLSLIDRTMAGLAVRRAVFVAAVALGTCAYVAINVRSIRAPRSTGSHVAVAQRLSGSVRAWIDLNIPPDAAIVATDGQATGFVLRRPTISLAPAEFSATAWTEDAIQRVMRTFDARFLITYLDADPRHDPVQSQSPFLSGLVRGDVPAWLTVVTENAAVRIFRAQ